MARTRKYYLKNNHFTLRSKSHEGHYCMRHTALWSCTHIPYIIDLSRKTKKLWSGQASLRSRSGRGRENQITGETKLNILLNSVGLYFYNMDVDRATNTVRPRVIDNKSMNYSTYISTERQYFCSNSNFSLKSRGYLMASLLSVIKCQCANKR